MAPESSPAAHVSRTHAILWCVWLALLVLAFLFCVLVALNEPDTAIGVSAVTEWAELVAGGPNGVDWNVSGFDLEACDAQGGVVQRVTLADETELRVKRGVTAIFEKREGSPDVRIDLTDRSAPQPRPAGACASATGVLVTGANHTWRPLYGGHVTLTYHHALLHAWPWVSPPRVLELWGRVTAGQAPRVGSDAMLLSGEIDLHATHEHGLAPALFTWLAGERTYIANTVTLRRGDLIVPPPPVKPPGGDHPEQPEARGYIRIPAADGLQLDYYVSADQTTVQRAGNAVVEFKLSGWSRIRNEPALSWALAALLLLLTSSELWPALATAMHHFRSQQQKQ